MRWDTHYYTDVLKKYAVFGGRTRRQEYWMFALFNAPIVLVLWLISLVAGNAGTVLLGLYGLAVLIPSLAVTWRRFHDTNRSGWSWLVIFFPFVGPIILVVFLALNGTPGPNRFGPDPKRSVGGYRVQAHMAVGGGRSLQVPAGWYVDPAGRHELRYWDGEDWTSLVSDADITSADDLEWRPALALRGRTL